MLGTQIYLSPVSFAILGSLTEYTLAGNFLVCLGVWQALAGQDILSKVFCIIV